MSAPRLKSDIGRFAIVPLRLLETGVSDRAIRLFAVLAARYADRDDVAIPSRATLAAALKVSPDTIDRTIKELKDAGAVKVAHRTAQTGSLTSNEYLLVYALPVADDHYDHGEPVPDPSRTDAATPAAPVRPPSRNPAATLAAPVRPKPDYVQDHDHLRDHDPLVQGKGSDHGDHEDQGVQVQALTVPPTRSRKKRTLRHDYSADFLRFWDLYPVPTGKAAAFDVWQRLGLSGVEVETLMRSLESHLRSATWRDPETLIPHARTWLYQRRWEDEPDNRGRSARGARTNTNLTAGQRFLERRGALPS